MSTFELPEIVRDAVAATNRGDSEAFLTAFTDDATVNDWGRSFTGRTQVAKWNETDNIGVHSHLEVLAVKAGPDDGVYITRVSVRGDGYNGDGTMTFTVRDGRIADLTIS